MAQHKLIDLDLLAHYDEKIKELIDSEEENTTYSLSAGTGADAQKIVLTDSDGNEDKVTVPYATKAGDADTVNGEVPDNIFKGTTDEWEALTTEEKMAYDAALFSDDYDEPDHMDADIVVYNNASSGLSADNVQDAVDEVNGKFSALGTASSKDVPISGNASSTQVVMGSDTRLTNARPASDVSAWAKASTKPTYTASEVGAIAASEKGSANGVAELDENGIVITAQLPSYVDDVLEYDSISDFPASGESGKIYVAKDTNITYRWSGTTYVEISPSLALGETSSTAYRGDRGKTAYDHSQLTSGNPHNVSKSDVGLGNITNDKQVKGLSSGTTENHVVTFGTDGYAIKDSGYTIGKSVPSDAVFTDTTYSAASDSGISLNSNTNEFSNSGVRSITVGNEQGTIRVNTNGTSRDVGIAGVYFGTDKNPIPTTWNLPTTNDTAHIEVTTSISRLYPMDKLILFLYDRYVNNSDEEPDYDLKLSFDEGTTWYPVYQMVNGNPIPVVFDRAQNIKMEPGRAYTLTYVKTLLEGEIFLIDDFKAGPNPFIGTSYQWSSQSAKAIYDIAFITND